MKMKIDANPGEIPRHLHTSSLAGEGLSGTSPYRAHKFGSLRNRSTRTLCYAFTLVGVSAITLLVTLLLVWYRATAP